MNTVLTSAAKKGATSLSREKREEDITSAP